MNGIDLQFDCLSDDCLKVLASYAVRELAARASNPDGGGWLDRIDEVPGISTTSLTTVHGYLIAQGMLKFEITGRSVGLQYQISTAGRDALNRKPAESADRTETEDAEIRHEAPYSRRGAA